MARSILDFIDHIELSMPSDILLYFIYFEKAFDSVEWDFLYHSLKVFKFGQTLMKWIKTFYKNISSCIIYNGSFRSPSGWKEV